MTHWRTSLLISVPILLGVAACRWAGVLQSVPGSIAASAVLIAFVGLACVWLNRPWSTLPDLAQRLALGAKSVRSGSDRQQSLKAAQDHIDADKARIAELETQLAAARTAAARADDAKRAQVTFEVGCTGRDLNRPRQPPQFNADSTHNATVGNATGLDLGIGVSQRLVAAWGGRLQVERRAPDGGISFGFTLPLALATGEQPCDGSNTTDRQPGADAPRDNANRASPAEHASQHPQMNLDGIRLRLNGDSHLLRRLLLRFRTDHADFVADYTSLFQAGAVSARRNWRGHWRARQPVSVPSSSSRVPRSWHPNVAVTMIRAASLAMFESCSGSCSRRSTTSSRGQTARRCGGAHRAMHRPASTAKPRKPCNTCPNCSPTSMPPRSTASRTCVHRCRGLSRKRVSRTCSAPSTALTSRLLSTGYSRWPRT